MKDAPWMSSLPGTGVSERSASDSTTCSSGYIPARALPEALIALVRAPDLHRLIQAVPSCNSRGRSTYRVRPCPFPQQTTRLSDYRNSRRLTP